VLVVQTGRQDVRRAINNRHFVAVQFLVAAAITQLSQIGHSIELDLSGMHTKIGSFFYIYRLYK